MTTALTKFCPGCATHKALDEFYRSGAREHLDGLQSECKSCQADRQRARKADWTPAQRARNNEATRRCYVRRRYGMTLAEYDSRIRNGRCEACGRRKRLVIDHCHATGKTRGVLCSNCNTALGLLREDERAIEGLQAYLHQKRKCMK